MNNPMGRREFVRRNVAVAASLAVAPRLFAAESGLKLANPFFAYSMESQSIKTWREYQARFAAEQKEK